MQLTREENLELIRNSLAELLGGDEHELRDRQHQALLKLAISEGKEFFEGYFNHATGSGKSLEMATLVKSFRSANSKQKTIILEESVKKVTDIAEDYTNPDNVEYIGEGMEVIGRFNKDHKDIDKPIIVATYASLKNLLKEIDPDEVGLVIADEAHKGLSEARMENIKSFENACIYGFTATPKYSEKKQLKEFLNNEIDELTLVEGVEKGLNCSVKNILLVSDVAVDLSKVKKNNRGDYDEEEFDRAVGRAHREEIKHKIVEFWANFEDEETGEKARDRMSMVNCTTLERAEAQVKAFNDYMGHVVAKAVGSHMNDEEQEKILNEFESGKFPVIVQVNTIGEAYNNQRLSLCINEPTGSFVRAGQRPGRVMRLDPDNLYKKAWVVDVVFKHPDFKDDEIIIAAEKNRQVLFGHILGKFEVNSDKRDGFEKALINKRTYSNKTVGHLDLDGFSIISKTKELFDIENAAAVWKEEHVLPPKGGFMRTASEVSKILYAGNPYIIEMLRKHRNEVLTDKDGKEIPLALEVFHAAKNIFVLNGVGDKVTDNHILKRFAEVSGIPFRDDVLTNDDVVDKLKIDDLRKIFVGKPGKIKDKMGELEGVEFAEGIPLVIAVSLSGRASYVLNQVKDKAANKAIIDMFAEKSGLERRDEQIVKTKFMMSANEMSDVYVGEAARFRKQMQPFCEEVLKDENGKPVLDAENNPIPIAIEMKVGGRDSIVMNGIGDEKIDAAIREYCENKLNLVRKGELPSKNKHMRSKGDLRTEYLGGERVLEETMENSFGKFIEVDGSKVPVIVKASAGGQNAFFLNGTGNEETDEAIQQFFERDNGLVNKRDVIAKNKHCLNAKDLDEFFIGGVVKIREALEGLQDKNLKDDNGESVLDENGEEIPLVMKIDLGLKKSYLCLNGTGNEETDAMIKKAFEQSSGLLKREGVIEKTEYMKSPIELRKIYIGEEKNFSQRIKELEGVIIKGDNGEDIPMAIWAKNRGPISLVLNGTGDEETDNKIADIFANGHFVTREYASNKYKHVLTTGALIDVYEGERKSIINGLKKASEHVLLDELGGTVLDDDNNPIPIAFESEIGRKGTYVLNGIGDSDIDQIIMDQFTQISGLKPKQQNKVSVNDMRSLFGGRS
ncbi:MAG: DEAD/DEAH box helicase family protein [Lactobacillus sp.]|jgi:superfamily II DNA or RNA helicase|nr:DEAD/DEAH box helicase family protein [Lactobacillus sp.]